MCKDNSNESDMIAECLSYVKKMQGNGKKLVGVMCAFAPREIIMASGAIPICLCGGSHGSVAVAEEYLPASLCPLIKSTFGHYKEKANPFLEMADIIVSETACDGKKKMFEMMAKDKPVYIMDLPHQPESPYARLLWLEQCRKLKDALEQKFDTFITQKDLRSAVNKMNKERSLRRELSFLMAREKPPFTGRELLNLNSIIACMPWATKRYKEALEKYSASEGCDELAGRVRVLLTGVPTFHGAECIVDIIESNGGLVVAQENCTGLKPIWDDIDRRGDDILEAIADKYLALSCSIMSPNDSRIELLRAIVRQFSPDCIIDLSWQGCLTYDVESHFINDFAGEKNLPFLKIHTDYSSSDSGKLTASIKSLFKSVRKSKK